MKRKNHGGVVIKTLLIVAFVLLLIYAFRDIRRNINSEKTLEPEIDQRCMLQPDPGRCRAYIPKYHFNQNTNLCEEFIWGGCEGTVPFEALEECQTLCEK